MNETGSQTISTNKKKLKSNTKHKGDFIYQLQVNCGLSILLPLFREWTTKKEGLIADNV